MTFSHRINPWLYHSLRSSGVLTVYFDRTNKSKSLLSDVEVRQTFIRAVHAWWPELNIVVVDHPNIADLIVRNTPLRHVRPNVFATTETFNTVVLLHFDSAKTRWAHETKLGVFRSVFGRTKHNLFATFLHELGHALFALDHVEEPTSIMYEQPNEYQPQPIHYTENVSAVPTRDKRALRELLLRGPLPPDDLLNFLNDKP